MVKCAVIVLLITIIMNISQIRILLGARRAELTELGNSSSQARQTVKLDQQSVGRLSRMDAMQVQAMAQATQRQREIELVKIEAAMQRLDDGEYGMCTSCSGDIATRRLEADPTASLCIKCAG